MDAPKRIWAWVDDLAGIVGQSDEPETPPNLPAGPNAISPCAEYILATDHARIVAEKDAEIARLRKALTPSAETKAAYWSEVECDCPTETWRHYVPWTSIKQIMKMIRARAALKGDDNG